MARTIDQIQDELITAVQADPTLSDLNSVSAVAIWRLWTRITAGGLETFEQLLDAFKEELEQIAREAVPGTADWLQRRVLEFQYDAASPQVIQVIDGSATYPVVDPSLRIISRAAVKETTNGRVVVKVAKDDGVGGLEPLTAAELSALEGYLSAIGFVGIPIDVTSQQSDRLRLQSLTVFFNPQIGEATVKADVIQAIEDYLSSISVDDFDGIVVRTRIVDVVQAVEGVTEVGDFVMLPYLRPFGTPAPGGKTFTVQGETEAGHVIAEDTPGFTLAETITFQTDENIPTA